jgi:hypothetical protein
MALQYWYQTRYLTKAAARLVDPGLVTTAVSDTAGRALGPLNITPVVAAGTDYFRNPRKRTDEHEAVVREFSKSQPDALADTVVRLGGPNVWQDMAWANPRDPAAPWYRRVGGRVLQNPRTGPLGKALGYMSAPLRAALVSAMRAPHYDQYSDAVNNPVHSVPITEHELGHAIDFNTMDGSGGRVSKSMLGRLGRGTLRDLYGLAYSIPGANLYHEARANIASDAAIRDQAPSADAYADRAVARSKVLPAAYGSYLGNAAADVIGAIDPVMGVPAKAMGAILGSVGGRQLSRDPEFLRALIERKRKLWRAEHAGKNTHPDEKPAARRAA